MSLRKKISIIVLIAVLAASMFGYWWWATRDAREVSQLTYTQSCASCHGDNLRGTSAGSDLLAEALVYGDSTVELMRSITELNIHQPINWPQSGPKAIVKSMALFVSERRQSYPAISSSYYHSFKPQTFESRHHRFRMEHYASLASRPYSIAPLPDGRLLVNEKTRGLSVVSGDGRQVDPVTAAPLAYDDFLVVEGASVGWGQMLDVELHPDYQNNGWIYIAYSDRCQWDCWSVMPQTMVKVVRGRLKDNAWVDQETIWSVHRKYYTLVPDGVAGGRLAFDQQGYLYITVGGKAHYKHLHNMNTPYGKVHRVKDDGSIPRDNPFWAPEGKYAPSSARNTVWTYGHRTAQGLTSHPLTGEIWEAEMGPRGGDEINKLIAGENYGWPLYTNGLDYDSEEVSIGTDLGLSFPLEDTQLPTVDFTPAPALSNLTFHQGNQFPGWQNDILVGSLKAMSLYRVRVAAGKWEETERLASELGRIRDVEMGADGLVYLAIEHGNAGSILRLVPDDI